MRKPRKFAVARWVPSKAASTARAADWPNCCRSKAWMISGPTSRPERCSPETIRRNDQPVPESAPRGAAQDLVNVAIDFRSAGSDGRLQDRDRIGRRERLLQAALERPFLPAPLFVASPDLERRSRSFGVRVCVHHEFAHSDSLEQVRRAIAS